MSEDPAKAADHSIVATASSEEGTHVLKAGETFAVLDRYGDIRPGGLGQLGLYRRGTRVLSRFELSIARRRPLLLGSDVTEDNTASVVDLTNPDVREIDGAVLHGETLHLERFTMVAGSSLHCRLRIRNYGLAEALLDLGLDLDADFCDVFEVRGERRPRRGACSREILGDALVRFSYQGLDGVERSTAISLDPAPRLVAESAGASASWQSSIPPGGDLAITIAVGPEPSRATPERFAATRERLGEVAGEMTALLARVESSHPPLDACLHRAAADLAMMLTETPYGLYPYAGVPWFSTPFGRDGIVTALEVLWLHPPIAAGVLRYLAATQATEEEAERDAEPGKILHESREGEMPNLGEVPFARYYGSIDATPLFVFLAGAYHRRTGDDALIERIWPQLRAALVWMDRYGDADGDGFLEYERRSAQGLRQQGWKDSDDSVFTASGEPARGPIALAEVQAYAYGAKLEAARLAEGLGERALASELRAGAAALRERFDACFWIEEAGTYALALDGAKQPCRVRTSNAGHCLLTGIVPEGRALRVATGLVREDLFSGWGIRTVGAEERRYNPMSYHNGSVWPHDNALVAAGFARYGLTSFALPVFEALVEAARWMPIDRLPELFCGFARRPGRGPTAYPLACAPQAWAAGAPYLLLASILGLEIDAADRRIVLRHPRLPSWLDQVCLEGIEVAGSKADLRVVRRGDTVDVIPRTNGGRVDVALVT